MGRSYTVKRVGPRPDPEKTAVRPDSVDFDGGLVNCSITQHIANFSEAGNHPVPSNQAVEDCKNQRKLWFLNQIPDCRFSSLPK